MSLFRYLKPASKVPTSEQTGLPPSVLKDVNHAVQKALNPAPQSGKKRKYTTNFMPADRAAIGRYAAENGNSAAVKKFKDTHGVGESTVRLFKKKYLDAVKKRHLTDAESEAEVTSLPARKRGRKMLLGEQLDAKVQSYVKALRSAGTPIGSSIVMAAATWDRLVV